MSGAPDTSSLQALVRERIDGWRSGGEPDAAVVLDEHPELRGAKSLVMDLVLAEYTLRTEAGHSIAKSTFCDRFPAYRQSIGRMLEVQEYLDQCPQFAIDQERAPWPEPGDDFLGYEVVESLGSGGLARVYLAREGAVGRRQVVIKVSRLASREAHTLGKLSHPGIVPIHSVQQDDEAGWTVICMPLVGVATAVDLLDAAAASEAAQRDGRLVARVAIERKPAAAVPREAAAAINDLEWRLPYADAIARLGLQLAEALEAAHAAGILHRDIKPSNVLLSWSGRPMLLDFNLSTDVDAAGERIGGTLAYMAPEQIECLLNNQAEAARRFDPRCDIYSLGVVLYELLTGRLPAKPDDAKRLPGDAYKPWLEAKRGAVAALDDAYAPVDSRLQAIVRKCLAYEAADRYATAAELAADLRTYLGTAAKVGRFATRHRRALVLAAIGFISTVFSAGTYLANRPTELELVYQRALGEYEAGDYDGAVKSFTRCLQLRSGWPDALFGRAQALRKLERWRDAADDFKQISTLNKPWSAALVGYSLWRAKDINGSWGAFRSAHEGGLRDLNFLLNYAKSEGIRQRHQGAAEIYSEVLELDPQNAIAIRARGVALALSVANRKIVPPAQAFIDARVDCERNPRSKDAHLCAAIVFAVAARHDLCFETDALDFLTSSMKLGMPVKCVKDFTTPLKPLLAKIDAAVVNGAEEVPQDYSFNPSPMFYELPDTADWSEFQRDHGVKPLLAKIE